MYTGWDDGKPVSTGVHAVDQNTKKTTKGTKDSGAPRCSLNANSMGECTATQQHDHGTIPNVFSGIAWFKCAPVSIEMLN